MAGPWAFHQSRVFLLLRRRSVGAGLMPSKKTSDSFKATNDRPIDRPSASVSPSRKNQSDDSDGAAAAVEAEAVAASVASEPGSKPVARGCGIDDVVRLLRCLCEL